MIDVVCAIIRRDDRVLIVQRSAAMPLPLSWEFPGGKVVADESPEKALVREIREELSLCVQPVGQLPSSDHRYSRNLHIRLIPRICRIVSGQIILHEHRAALWQMTHVVDPLRMAPADQPILQAYMENEVNFHY